MRSSPSTGMAPDPPRPETGGGGDVLGLHKFSCSKAGVTRGWMQMGGGQRSLGEGLLTPEGVQAPWVRAFTRGAFTSPEGEPLRESLQNTCGSRNETVEKEEENVV